MLVTGALAARGEEVVELDNLNPYCSPQLKRDLLAALCPGIRFVEADFVDEAALDAALAGVRHLIDTQSISPAPMSAPTWSGI